MVVGFLNAGLLKLEQSVYIIMGANIGTTVTSFLIGLKIDAVAPVLIIVGACSSKRSSCPIWGWCWSGSASCSRG